MQTAPLNSDENQALRRSVRDLAALSILSAAWSRTEPNGIAESLADVLSRMLAVDFIYVRVHDPAGQDAYESARRPPGSPAPDRTQEIGKSLNPLLKLGVSDQPAVIASPFNSGMVQLAIQPLGCEGNCGFLVAGSQQPDFPSQIDRLMLEVAANQAAIVLQHRRAEQSLRESEEPFRRLVEEVSDYAIFMLDPDGRVVSWNAGAERIKGYKAEEIIGQHFSRFYPEQAVQEGLPAQALKIATAEGRWENEGWRVRKEDSRFWGNVVITAMHDGEGVLRGFSKITRDLTERRRAEEAVRQSDARKTAMFQTALDCVVGMNHEGKIVEFNAAAERTFGYRCEDVLGREMADLIIPPALRERHRRGMAHYLATGVGPVLDRRIEMSAIRADGSEFPVELAVTRIPTDGPPLFTAYVRDITERRRAETALREHGERLRLATQTGKVGIWDWDIVANRVSWTDSLYPIHGLSKEQFNATAEGFAALVHPDDRDLVSKAIEASLNHGAAYELEFRALKPDGQVIWIFTNAIVLRSGDKPVRMIGATVDITGRKQAEETLREMNLALAHAMPGISVLSPEGRYVSVNQAYAQMNGYEPAEMIGVSWEPTVHSDDWQHALAAYQRMLNEGNSELEARAVRKDGSVFYKHVLMVKRLDRDGHFLGHHCFMKDITERKQAEEAVRRHAEEVEKLMEVMPVAVWIARDPECKQITGNEAGYSLLRTPPGRNLSKTAPLEELPTAFRIMHAGKEVPPEDLPMQYAAAHGVEVRDYKEAIVFEDGTVVHAYGSASPHFDERGKVRGCIAAFMDVSELQRLERELRQKVEELALADRRKDEFLATLAHELRNPLAPLRNAVELLRRSDGNAALIEQARGMMERQVGQMVRLVDDLLDVSRITQDKVQLRRERVELAALVQSAVEAARPLMEAQAHELTVTLPPQPVFLDADPTRLAQVFLNLLTNAAKYTEKGGHVWLTAERQGGEVVVSVRDTGIGIAAEHLPHIFEMFSQVQPALERSQEGLGIGLSLVRGLVEVHSGSVEARSGGIGRGSEFIVRLPIAGIPLEWPPKISSRENACSVRSCRILVVDDNRDAADSLALMLRMMGHEADTAYDGLEGVHAAATFRPEVVLLDIGLPKMNGYEAARLIRQQPWGQAMALITLTGWGQEEDKRRALEAGFDHHLTKPVQAVALEKLLALIILGPQH